MTCHLRFIFLASSESLQFISSASERSCCLPAVSSVRGGALYQSRGGAKCRNFYFQLFRLQLLLLEESFLFRSLDVCFWQYFIFYVLSLPHLSPIFSPSSSCMSTSLLTAINSKIISRRKSFPSVSTLHSFLNVLKRQTDVTQDKGTIRHFLSSATLVFIHYIPTSL